MTRYIRTWLEHEPADPDAKRWNVLVNDKPVPGGYIVQIADAAFEIHYPHLETKVLDTFEEAKRCIELAPPISKGDLSVGRPVDNEEDELIGADEAGELLGVSRYRINAMVANGVLAGKRSDGRTFVSRASIETRLARQDVSGPVGRFAHTFICYHPESGAEPWRLAELDPQDSAQIEEAKQFVRDVLDKTIPGKTDVLDYRQAMALRAKAKREHGGDAAFAEPISLGDLVASTRDEMAKNLPA